MTQPARKGAPAERLLFPAAALFAALAVPVWVASLTGRIPAPAPYWHAHEMLFGYALAVIGGYLLSRVARPALWLLFASWLAARAAALGGAGGLVAAAPNVLFAALVAALAAPPFLRAAKKAENRVFGPLLIALAVCEAAYQLDANGPLAGLGPVALLVALDLFTLLLALMGGRVIPPAMAGYFYRRGQVLAARVQPRLERAVILLLLGMTALDLVPAARPAAGAAALAAAAVTAVRAWRWRVWAARGEPHLWALGLGYAWLVPGLALKGIAQISGLALSVALHGLTVGTLGTLTLVMMARTRLQRSRQGLERFGDIAVAAVLISVAAVLRLAVALVDPAWYAPALWGSAFAWTAAFGLLLRRLLRVQRAESNSAARAPGSASSGAADGRVAINFDKDQSFLSR